MSFLGFLRGLVLVAVGGFIMLAVVMSKEAEPKERMTGVGLGLAAITIGMWKIKRFFSGVD